MSAPDSTAPSQSDLRAWAREHLVGCSAVLTGAEAAYFSLGRARLRRMAGEGEGEVSRAPLIERPHDLLVTLLVGITVINIGAAAAGEATRCPSRTSKSA